MTRARRWNVWAAATLAEKRELRAGLAAAQFPTTSTGARKVLLAFTRSDVVRTVTLTYLEQHSEIT